MADSTLVEAKPSALTVRRGRGRGRGREGEGERGIEREQGRERERRERQHNGRLVLAYRNVVSREGCKDYIKLAT